MLDVFAELSFVRAIDRGVTLRPPFACLATLSLWTSLSMRYFVS